MPREMPSHFAVNSRTTISQDSPADMEVFKEIDQDYFTDSKEYDPSRYILEKIPFPVDCANIEEVVVKLKRQQRVVSSKALHLITEQRESCDREFEAILLIQEDLGATIDTCRSGRCRLKVAMSNLTASAYGILANHRKSQTILGLLESLRMIRKLCRAEERVQTLFKSREYEVAVQLILTSRKEAAKNKEYKCVASLLQRLQDTLEFVEEQLDGVLAEMCLFFEEETYTKLQKAYALLDKTQVAMDQLHMHFASAINNGALEVLKSHQKDESDQALSPDQVKLKELSAGVKENAILSCLLDLCDRLWQIMHCYYKVVEWHSKNDQFIGHNTNVSEFEMNVSKEYVKQKLQNGLMRIWQDVQSKISVFLIQSGLPNYTFEKFIQVLGILRRLMDVAREFCGDTSETLQNFIKSHSLAYLKNYHSGRMEVLRIFLENEAWELCPVKSKFNTLQLQEFEKIKRPIKKFLENSDFTFKDSPRKTLSDTSSSAPSQDDSFYIGNYFAKPSKHTPFDIFRHDMSAVEDILELESEYETNSDESDDEPEELTMDFVDENPCVNNITLNTRPNLSKQEVAIVTNTTLSVLRDCGQYLQMCRFLQPISFEVIMLMSQMFDYYLYAVHLFFASDLKVSSTTLYSSKLTNMLKRIRNNLTLSNDEDQHSELNEHENNPRNQKTIVPQSLQIVDLNNPENLNGLAERIVAVESLVFLSKQFIILQPYLESLIPAHQKIILETFYQQTVSAAVDIRIPVYMCVACQAFNIRNIMVAMSQVNWEVKNIMSQHSGYVDLLVRDIQVFSMRLDLVGKNVPISFEVYKSIWSCVSKFIVHTLVEGFSNVSKCSDSGRGLMQLDYTQLLSNMEKISGLKSMPHYEYVDTYVKAYYIGKSSLEDFIKQHTEYSVKHLTALVNCVCHTKKCKQELINIIQSRDA